jgi:hypothetical protein
VSVQVLVNAEDARFGLADIVGKGGAFAGGRGAGGGFPLSGYPVPDGYAGGIGQCDPVWKASLAEAEYVIFSYETPVAWLVSGVWNVPDASHSRTTNRWVNAVRSALNIPRTAKGL